MASVGKNEREGDTTVWEGHKKEMLLFFKQGELNGRITFNRAKRGKERKSVAGV